MNARTGALSSPLPALRQPLSQAPSPQPPPPESRKGPDTPVGLSARKRSASSAGLEALPPRGELRASPSSTGASSPVKRQRTSYDSADAPAAATPPHGDKAAESATALSPEQVRTAAASTLHATPPSHGGAGEVPETHKPSSSESHGHTDMDTDMPPKADGGVPHAGGPAFSMPHVPPTPSHPHFGHGDDDAEDGEDEPPRADGSTRKAITAQEQQMANQNALTEASVRAQMQASLNEFSIKSVEGLAKAIKSMAKAVADLVT
ncbi:hypothetical protein QRO11_11720 [Paracidovorax citrulli]|uniref:hypothetical protein n=2 Tax=Paracidovorax citrulli TaxID=80869 RepID=UPI001D18866E|nr:hypothetical protein [Paracidovorax citrulli]UEG44236.1 hypothetical protein LKW27_11095 [Paracidovorax citrulli]WIY32655.1 hypothetical protein QRO11_11720 [Paracidovorax citrulli]